MKQRRFFSVRRLSTMGVMAAMIFLLTKFVSIPIDTPAGKTALHLGNVMCLLSGLLFGPVTGGLSAGFGSMLVDLTDPLWMPEFWITFLNKFLMAFLAGLLIRRRREHRSLWIWLSSAIGSLAYCLLYLVKNVLTGILVLGFTRQVAIAEVLAVKLPVALVNGAIATVCAAVLYLSAEKPLRQAHIL